MRRDLRFIVLTREALKVWCNYLRQHFLLSYFKTLTVGPAVVELTTSRVIARCSTNWATGARCWRSFFILCSSSFFILCWRYISLRSSNNVLLILKKSHLLCKCRARGCLCELKDWVVLKEQVTNSHISWRQPLLGLIIIATTSDTTPQFSFQFYQLIQFTV